MIKFKTTLSFGFNLERCLPQPQKEEEKKAISKVFMVVEEIVKKHWLKS